MPMDKSRYPADWDAISLRIRFERAQSLCEWCGAVNGQPHPETGSKVVLTVHHIGIDKPDGTPGDRHDKMDVREDNLAALCQRCHWKADWDIHYEKAVEAKRAKRLATGQLELWPEGGAS
jgi:hypothetical protein